jgi:hypothetical protein
VGSQFSSVRENTHNNDSFILAESLWNDLGILGPQLAGYIRSFRVNDDTRANFGVGLLSCQSNIGVDRVFSQQWGTPPMVVSLGIVRVNDQGGDSRISLLIPSGLTIDIMRTGLSEATETSM